MHHNENQQLFQDSPEYTKPDSKPDNKVLRPTKAKSGKTSKPRKPSVVSNQPYLPGLSRRGRPRLKDAKPPTVRASESRQRRLGTGAKRIELILEAETINQLDILIRHFQVTRVEIISRLIAKAAKRIPETR